MAERRMSRKWLEALGIDADKIDVIVEAHSEAMQAIRDERDAAIKACDEVKAELSSIDRTRDWKKLFEDAEAESKTREERAAKETAFKAIYKEIGIPEKYYSSLLKIADYDSIDVDATGKAKNAYELAERMKSDFADFIPTQSTVNNQQTPTPPLNGGKVHMTRDQILAIKDRGERQKAIAENMSEFGY